MKKFYQSRTLWVNLIAAVAFFVQQQFGYPVPAEMQGILLAAVNFALRLDTDSAVGS